MSKADGLTVEEFRKYRDTIARSMVTGQYAKEEAIEDYKTHAENLLDSGFVDIEALREYYYV